MSWLSLRQDAGFLRDLRPTAPVAVLLGYSQSRTDAGRTIRLFVHGGPFASIAPTAAIRSSPRVRRFELPLRGDGSPASRGLISGLRSFFDIKCHQGRPCANCNGHRCPGAGGGGVWRGGSRMRCPGAGRRLRQSCRSYRQSPFPACLPVLSGDKAISRRIQMQRSRPSILLRSWTGGYAGRFGFVPGSKVGPQGGGVADAGEARPRAALPDHLPDGKDRHRCLGIYRAGEVTAVKAVRDQLHSWEERAYGDLPVCIIRHQYSFSAKTVSSRRANTSCMAREILSPERASSSPSGVTSRQLGYQVTGRRRILLNENGHIEGLSWI